MAWVLKAKQGFLSKTKLNEQYLTGKDLQGSEMFLWKEAHNTYFRA